MEAYYVYMLRCRGGSLYTGMTNDVARRMAMQYAIKAKLTHGQKETLAAAPGRIGEWFPALPAEAVTTLPAGKEFPIFANQT